jgi:hypothetical protein
MKAHIMIALCLSALLSISIETATHCATEKGEKEDEKSLKAKAVDGLIKSMPTIFTDVLTMQSMTEDQKINYVLTKAEDRIKSQIADKFQEDMKQSMIDYAKKSLRANAFMQDAAPQIRHAVFMGQEFDWSKLDKKVQEKADENFKNAMKAIDAAKFSYEVFQTAHEKGMLEAFKSVSAQLYDSLASSYIPGWAYFKMGVEAVKAIGNYIMEFATDTAIEGMLNTMYSMKRDPEGFAKWVVNKSPSAISTDIDDKWELVSGDDFVYEGKGTEKGEEAMRKKLLSTMMDMRRGVLTQLKEVERKEEQVKREAERYLRPAKDAEQKLRDVAATAKKEAADAIAKVRDFKTQYFSYAKQDAESEFAKAEAVRAQEKNRPQSTVGTAIRYEPMDRIGILGALRTALAEIKDSGTDGYDAATFKTGYEAYQKLRQEAINASNASVAQKIAAANKYDAELRAAASDGDGWKSEDAYKAYASAARPYWNAQYILGPAQGQDFARLASEETIAILEANERATRMGVKIQTALEELGVKMNEGVAEFSNAKEMFERELRATLNYPDAWRNPDYLEKVVVGGLPPRRDRIGEVQVELRNLQDALDKLKKDQTSIGPLHTKEEAFYTDYARTAEGVYREFLTLVPKKLQEITAAGERDAQYEYLLRAIEFNPGAGIGMGLIPDLRDKYIRIPRIPRMSIDDPPIAQTLAKIHKVPMDPSSAISTLTKRLPEVEDLAHIDEVAALFVGIHSRVANDSVMLQLIYSTMEEVKQKAADVFPLKDNGSVMYVLPEQSEGAAYLAKLEPAWEKNRSLVETLKNLRKQIGNSIRYSFDLQKSYFPTVDIWDSAPERIRIYREKYEQSKRDYNERVDIAERYYSQAMAEYDQVMKGSAFSFESQVLALGKINDKAKSYLQLYRVWKPNDRLAKVVNDWQKLTASINSALADIKRQSADERTDARRKSEEAEKAREWARQEEERKKQEEEKREQESRLAKAEETQRRTEGVARDQMASVRSMYDQFKQAYESRNDPKVMACIGDDWQSGDGTTISDLQVNLNRTFKTFDEIRYIPQNIQIQRRSEGVYSVSYDVTITSRIFKRNLKHEEKSSVTEEVVVDRSGKAKISKTLNGRFWYVK